MRPYWGMPVEAWTAADPEFWKANLRTWSGRGSARGSDIPHMMAEHDDAHRAEIAAWSGDAR